jgi:pyruvate/2-oxoglutarate dehydrogenase complex dihydrolipoamide acyltransferase (E2) component
MDTFIIDVPTPSMGATVHELNVVTLKVRAGDRVSKGQKIAELESDKSIFEFESPCDGMVRTVHARAGGVQPSGSPFLEMETTDASLRHLEARVPEAVGAGGAATDRAGAAQTAARPSRPAPIWTPRATKLAQDAGLDPSKVDQIEATGPGGRVSGDDVTRYLELRKR